MTRTEQIIWSSFVRVLSVIIIIACLCFSDGEGLRLTPLPVLSLEEFISLSRSTPNYLGGPLNRPAQVQLQKLNKRHGLDCECPPISSANKIYFHPLPYLVADDSGTQIFHVSEATPPGRAPPTFS